MRQLHRQDSLLKGANPLTLGHALEYRDDHGADRDADPAKVITVIQIRVARGQRHLEVRRGAAYAAAIAYGDQRAVLSSERVARFQLERAAWRRELKVRAARDHFAGQRRRCAQALERSAG